MIVSKPVTLAKLAAVKVPSAPFAAAGVMLKVKVSVPTPPVTVEPIRKAAVEFTVSLRAVRLATAEARPLTEVFEVAPV